MALKNNESKLLEKIAARDLRLDVVYVVHCVKCKARHMSGSRRTLVTNCVKCPCCEVDLTDQMLLVWSRKQRRVLSRNLFIWSVLRSIEDYVHQTDESMECNCIPVLSQFEESLSEELTKSFPS